jgi:hypothetical protein
MRIKATAEATGGAYGLLESWVRAGSSPPLHVHHREDARLLTLLSPGGGERFFVDAARTPEGPGLPPPGPPDVATLKQVLARYGSEIVGPPLTPWSPDAEAADQPVDVAGPLRVLAGLASRRPRVV